MNNKIRIILIDDKFAVGMDTGKERDGKGVFGILRSFDYPPDALIYAAGIVDGWQLTNGDGGYFVPFDSDNLAVTPDVAAVLNALIHPVESEMQ